VCSTKELTLKRTSSLFEGLYLSTRLKAYKGAPLSGFSVSIIIVIAIITILS
jgi:hypothetical protein